MDLPRTVEDAPDAADLGDVEGRVGYGGVSFGYGEDPVLDGTD